MRVLSVSGPNREGTGRGWTYGRVVRFGPPIRPVVLRSDTAVRLWVEDSSVSVEVWSSQAGWMPVVRVEGVATGLPESPGTAVLSPKCVEQIDEAENGVFMTALRVVDPVLAESIDCSNGGG